MEHLEDIAERIHDSFEARTAAREKALSQARTLTRSCANAIRAIHRGDRLEAEEYLNNAKTLVDTLHSDLIAYPNLYYAGYTQDALKEFAEASVVYALFGNGVLPSPDVLELEPAVYMRGLAEAVGELRRYCLDALLHNNYDEAEKSLAHMDDIYGILVTMDYPDAITGGLRRLTDIARSLTERTRGDLTMSLRQARLERSLRDLEGRLEEMGELGR
jgi:translin